MDADESRDGLGDLLGFLVNDAKLSRLFLLLLFSKPVGSFVGVGVTNLGTVLGFVWDDAWPRVCLEGETLFGLGNVARVA